MATSNCNNWGGLREGAGRRKEYHTKSIGIRISEEAFEKLNQLTNNKSKFINDLILSI